jgi:hypothetical protein
VKNLAELADGPALYVTWQGQDICFVACATPLSSSLAFSFQLEISAAKNWQVTYLILTRHRLRNMSVANTEVFRVFVKGKYASVIPVFKFVFKY